MIYILAAIVTIYIAYTVYRITEKLMQWIDKLFDYLEREKNERH